LDQKLGEDNEDRYHYQDTNVMFEPTFQIVQYQYKNGLKIKLYSSPHFSKHYIFPDRNLYEPQGGAYSFPQQNIVIQRKIATKINK